MRSIIALSSLLVSLLVSLAACAAPTAPADSRRGADPPPAVAAPSAAVAAPALAISSTTAGCYGGTRRVVVGWAGAHESGAASWTVRFWKRPVGSYYAYPYESRSASPWSAEISSSCGFSAGEVAQGEAVDVSSSGAVLAGPYWTDRAAVR